MSEYKEIIVNIKTGETIERQYTAKEIKEIEKTQAALQNLQVEVEAKQAAKDAVLAKLGLTADEVAALLG